jgi:hypothetical protein
MSNIVSIHQPSYFPWLGLLNKIMNSDTFILLDTVQLNDNAFQSRNIFLNHTGEVQYLGIPVQKKDYQNKAIKDLKVFDKRWQKKHKGFMVANYKKHTYFDEIYPLIENIFSKNYVFLVDILIDSMEVSNNIFDIKTDIVLASELDINFELTKDDLVLDILKKSSATKYISGTGAKDYQSDSKFEKRGVELEYQSFSHPQYTQKNAKSFELGLSALDVAFNLGIDKSIDLLKET